MKLLYSVLVVLLCSYKGYDICLISLFSLHKLFTAFTCTNITGSQVNSFFEVKILIYFAFTFRSPYNSSMIDTFSLLPNTAINFLSFDLLNRLP